jgi:hypothetical protein
MVIKSVLFGTIKEINKLYFMVEEYYYKEISKNE